MKLLPVIFLIVSLTLLASTRILSNTFLPKTLLIVFAIISLVLSLISAVWGYLVLRKEKD